MKPLSLVGCYLPDTDLSVAATIGNLVVLSDDTPALDNHSNLRAVLNVHIWGELLAEEPEAVEWFEASLTRMRAQIEAAGRLAQYEALMLSGEHYDHLKAKKYDHIKALQDVGPDPVARAVALQGALDRLGRRVKRLWPGVLIGGYETYWHNPLVIGCHPVPDSYDYLAVDAYALAPIREQFDRQVIPAVDATIHAAGDRPVVMIAQAFRGGGQHDPAWTEMPDVTQLKRFVDLAQERPIAVLLWFALQRPSWYEGKMLMDYPAQLAAVKAYWQWCQDEQREVNV